MNKIIITVMITSILLVVGLILFCIVDLITNGAYKRVDSMCKEVYGKNYHAAQYLYGEHFCIGKDGNMKSL